MLGRRRHEEKDDLAELATSFALGLLFLAGICATWGLGRFNHLTLFPVLLTGLALWNWRPCPCPPKPARQSLVRPVIAVLAGGFLLTWMWNTWWRGDGGIESLNMDLGYFAQMAKGLPEAKVESVWAAVLGPCCQASGETSDVWYHWCPIWLTSGFSALLRRPPLEVLLFVIAPVLNIVLIIVAGALVRRIAGWTNCWSLVAGAASLTALAFPSMAELSWLARLVPLGVVQHVHVSLAYQFSYKFEAVLVLATLLCWLNHRLPLSALLLFCAGLSAPHTVASGGITAGLLGLTGLLRRDARQCRLAAGIIGMLVLAWAVSHWCFGVDLPKSGAAKFIELQPALLARNLGHGLVDILVGTLLALLVMPGIVHCVRSREAPEIRLLGWLAISALTGAYLAFHLLLPEGDRSHFITFAHALLVMPIGFWGMARMASLNPGLIRSAAVGTMIAATALGVYDMESARVEAASLPCPAASLAQIKQALAGRPFGYFAAQDRNWWISRQALLAGLLDSRGVRLNQIDSVDVQTEAARFYGPVRIRQLVPPYPGEPAARWSLRLARGLGIHHILEIGTDGAPPALSAHLQVVLQFPGIRLLKIQDEPTHCNTLSRDAVTTNDTKRH